TALYRAKDLGRDGYQLYVPAMTASAIARLELEGELRNAIERHEFMVYYQPQVDAKAGRIVAVEALVRWQHPVRGLVMPNDFIAVAEETGMIVALGEWVLGESCHQLK